MKPLACGLLLVSAAFTCQTPAQSISFLTQLCPDLLPNSSPEQFEQSWACPERQRPLLQEKFDQLVKLSPTGLSISSQSAPPFQFRHHKVDGEQFRLFAFDGCTEDERYCLVFAAGWESWQHLLLDRKTGNTYSFTGTLYLSPDQRHLLELQDSRLSDIFSRNIIKLYQLSDNAPQLQLDLSDSDFGGHQPQWLNANEVTLQLWYHNTENPQKLEYRNQLTIQAEGRQWRTHIRAKPEAVAEVAESKQQ